MVVGFWANRERLMNIFKKGLAKTVDEGVLRPSITLAKMLGKMPVKETIIATLYKGCDKDIREYVKRHDRLPTEDELFGNVPTSFIKTMGEIGVSEQDIKGVIQDMLSDATIEKFRGKP